MPVLVAAIRFEQRLVAAGKRALDVALQQRGEGLGGPATRDAAAQALLTRSSDEEQLKIQRLLGPERAVVVERRDALGEQARSPANLASSPWPHEADDRLLDLAVIPRRKRIGLDRRATADEQQCPQRDDARMPELPKETVKSRSCRTQGSP